MSDTHKIEETNRQLSELRERVDTHDAALFGDRENPKERPGVIAELARTNELLTELRDSVRWLVRVAIGGFVAAMASGLVALVIKGLSFSASHG